MARFRRRLHSFREWNCWEKPLETRRPQAGYPRLAGVASTLLLDPAAAATQVAEAVLNMLIALGLCLQAAEDVAAREIRPGFSKVLASHAEVLSGLIEVVVVMVVMVAMAALTALCTLATAKETTQHLSDEGHGETCESKHSPFSVIMRYPRRLHAGRF